MSINETITNNVFIVHVISGKKRQSTVPVKRQQAANRWNEAFLSVSPETNFDLDT